MSGYKAMLKHCASSRDSFYKAFEERLSLTLYKLTKTNEGSSF